MLGREILRFLLSNTCASDTNLNLTKEASNVQSRDLSRQRERNEPNGNEDRIGGWESKKIRRAKELENQKP